MTMSFSDRMMALVHNEEVREASTNFLFDTAEAVLGNPFAAARVFLAIYQFPFFYNEQRFWSKMEDFLNGVFLGEEDRAKFSALLTENGEKSENPYRLVECINRAETKQKIRYIINATRCLLSEFINTPDYFRICHIITQTVEEDLLYVRDHLHEKDLPYSAYVQGLLTSGLMFQSVIDASGKQKYSFTPLAEFVDRYAVSYEDVEKYPNPSISTFQIPNPQPKLPGMDWEEINSEEIVKLFNE